MSYFSKFPKALYSTNNFETTDLVTNVVVRFNYLSKILNNADSFYPYVIREGERLDTIADMYYGDPKYAWVIASFNQYIDPLWEMPLRTEEFESYIKREYGSVAAAKANVKYYLKTLNKKDYVVDASQAYDKTQSSYDFELDLNEKRRNIKLLANNLIPQIEAEFEDLLNG